MIKLRRRTTAGALAAALTGALALAIAPANAATPTTAPAHHQAAARDVVCTVNDNGVNYRSGPGSEYPVMGTVNKGQKMNAHGRQGNWIMGDLWGGPTGVWIHVAYLDC